MNKVAVIDYGMGNLHSVAKAVEFVGAQLDHEIEVVVTADAAIIASADRVIFPGVGAIRDCMAEIRRLGIDQIVADVIKTKPLLAICVGMQALMTHSEENQGVDCLNLIKGQVRYFGDDLKSDQGERLKVPHMGWNMVQQRGDHPLWKDIADNSRFYFVHSYFIEAEDEQDIAGVSEYGAKFAAVLARDNVFAVQFHPEKSQTPGLALLKNFLQWDGVR